MKWLASWGAAIAISLLRSTCRIRVYNDPRPQLRAAGIPYVYSILHAHQVAITIGAEPGTGAMVSRSADGDIIARALKIRGCIPVRGSGGGKKSKHGKGGGTALRKLIEHVHGGRPAVLAVDGPNGPRNQAHRGVAVLASETNAVVLNVVTIPSRRWILSRTWDRLQIPKPFSTIHGYFAEPISRRENETEDEFLRRIETSLNELERSFDPDEAGSKATQELSKIAA